MKTSQMRSAWLDLDCASEADRICLALRNYLTSVRRRGLVIALSGGIDSSVCAALAVRAVGRDRVFGLLMPERWSDEKTLPLSRMLAESLGIRFEIEEITGPLEAFGFYRRYEEAARQAIPEFTTHWRSKVVIRFVSGTTSFNYFSIVAEAPDGRTVTERLPLPAYLQIVAATNFKQRTRKTLEYYHADRLNFAVVGTPNRLEYDQGFFVKLGDGAADIKPIAHLYKTQVYAMADFLNIPAGIRERRPTTDTYSLPQSQEEFYFSLPFEQMDLCLHGKNHGASAESVAAAAGLTPMQVRAVWADIDRKRLTTRYLHAAPVLVSEVPEITNFPPPSGRTVAGC